MRSLYFVLRYSWLFDAIPGGDVGVNSTLEIIKLQPELKLRGAALRVADGFSSFFQRVFARKIKVRLSHRLKCFFEFGELVWRKLEWNSENVFIDAVNSTCEIYKKVCARLSDTYTRGLWRG